MDLGLQGRRALVTGASRGIGAAVALALAAEGARVLAVARDQARLDTVAAACPAGAGSISARTADLAERTAIEGLAGEAATIDVLVLNSGGPPPGPVSEVTDGTWQAQFESMFLSMVRLTRLALPGMRQRRYGRILAVVSSGVVQPIASLGISNALRLAVVGWAKTLAGEVAADGVTVNCIAPGRIATDRIGELDRAAAARSGVSLEEVERQSRAAIPAGRTGEPAEFAALAAFLASSRASYMTGGVLRVDGGMIRGL
ncbi:MAG: SDR family oxidoreductase [Proteobacteria bacterium]|nr:SDR family oxidoreductase [Pseudomonadota bacterium]